MEALGAAGSIIGILNTALATTKSLKKIVDQRGDTTETVGQQISAFDNLHDLLKRYLEIERRTSLKDFPKSTSLQQTIRRCIKDLSFWQEKLRKHRPNEYEGSGFISRSLRKTRTGFDTDELRWMWPVLNSHISSLQSHLNFIQLSLLEDHKKSISQLPEIVHAKFKPIISEAITDFSSLQDNVVTQLLDQHAGHDAELIREVSKTQAAQENLSQDMKSVRDRITDLQSINPKQYSTIEGLLQEILANQTTCFLGKANKELDVNLQAPIPDMLSEAGGTETKLCAGEESIGESSIQSCLERLYALATEKNNIISGDDNNPKAAQSIIKDLKRMLWFASTELDTRPSERASDQAHLQPRRFDSHNDETQALESSFERIDRILGGSHAIVLNPVPAQRHDMSPKPYNSHNAYGAVESDFGPITLFSSTRKPKNEGENLNTRRSSSGETNVTEVFSGTVTHLSKTSQRSFKMMAIFQRKVKAYESSCLHPQLIFCAVIPANSAVFQRIKEGNLDDLVKLLELGVASLTDCDPEGRSLLNYACNSAKSEICKFLIEKGANVDSLELTITQRKAAYKPLMLQMIQNSNRGESTMKCHRLLLEAGADPTVGGSGRYSIAIEDAARAEIVNLVPTMLAHGRHFIDLEARYRDGNTLLLVSLQGNCDYLGTAIDLIRHGANVHARNDKEETCLLVMSNCWDYEHLYYNSLCPPQGRYQSFKEFLILAIENHADIHAVDNEGHTISRNVYGNDHFPDESWEDSLAATGHDVAEVLAKHLEMSGWTPSQDFPRMPYGDLEMLRKLSWKHYRAAHDKFGVSTDDPFKNGFPLGFHMGQENFHLSDLASYWDKEDAVEDYSSDNEDDEDGFYSFYERGYNHNFLHRSRSFTEEEEMREMSEV